MIGWFECDDGVGTVRHRLCYESFQDMCLSLVLSLPPLLPSYGQDSWTDACSVHV